MTTITETREQRRERLIQTLTSLNPYEADRASRELLLMDQETETKRARQFNESLRITCQMDDLAEAMALGIETHLEHHVKEVAELRVPLAAWRAFRPVKGLVGSAGGTA